MLLACYSHKHISYRIRTIIRKAINACFPVTSVEEEGDKFLLGSSKLSEQLWNLKYKPILERFSVTHHYKVEDFTNQKVIRFGVAEHYVHFENNLDLKQKDAIHELES